MRPYHMLKAENTFSGVIAVLVSVPYNRAKAVDYAEKWAFARNPKFSNFDTMGGDCTNFASQCLFSGCGVMNYTPTFGWFYSGQNSRSPAWSGVEFLYRFLVSNRSTGPHAAEITTEAVMPGDLVQLGHSDGHFYHTPVVVAVSPEGILVAAHTFDAFRRPLSSYSFDRVRCLHISGAMKWG